MKASGTLCEYKVVGCCLPTPKCCMLPLYRMRIFAPNHAVAKSRFWYFCVSTEDDEEILRGNGLLWTGVRNLPFGWRTSASGCTVTPTACTGSSRTWPQLVPSPRATETWALAPSLGPLNPDCEGGGDRSQQVPPTSGQAVPRLQDQVPTAAPGPPLPAQATLRQQEAQHLLLGVGPLCPWVCPNKTQVGKPETKKKPRGRGNFQDSGGLRYGDRLPPHKYIKNTSACGATPTDHLLKAGRRSQTSKKQKDPVDRLLHSYVHNLKIWIVKSQYKKWKPFLATANRVLMYYAINQKIYIYLFVLSNGRYFNTIHQEIGQLLWYKALS